MAPPCSLARQERKETNSQSQRKLGHVSSESSNSISSELSLPSLPSLDLQNLPTISHHYQCIATLKGHSAYISALAVRGKSLYSGSADGEIRWWSSAVDFLESHVVAATKSPVKSLVVVGDQKLLLSAHQDHKIRVWRTDEAKPCKLRAVLPTMRSRCLSMLSADNYVEVRRHKKITWVHHADAVSALALSPDLKFLYSVSWDRSIQVWRMSDFRCLTSVAAAHHDAINAVAVAHDGLVYTGSADKTIKVWRRSATAEKAVTLCLVSTLEKHKSAVNALALSAHRDGGDVLYSGACDRSVVVWERNKDGSAAAAGALRGHARAILCLAATANVICSGSADKTVRVWRMEEDRRHCCLAVLEGHRGPIKSLAVAGDERTSVCSSSCGSNGICYLVLSGCMDCDIKVWKVCVPVSGSGCPPLQGYRPNKRCLICLEMAGEGSIHLS